MQIKLFKSKKMNDIQNYIINNDLESDFKLVEIELIYSHGQRYTFFRNERIIESFEIENQSVVDEHVCYQYILGYLDCYLTVKGIDNNSSQSRLNIKDKTI